LPYDIDAAGASTTALAFLPGPVTPSTTIPLYLLGGTAANHLQLFSLTPTASGNSFVAANVSASTTLGDPFDTVISAILYVPSLATVYVAGENGNLYSYSVTWNGSAPTLTYEHTNNIYTYDPATGNPPTASIAYAPLGEPLIPYLPMQILTCWSIVVQPGCIYIPLPTPGRTACRKVPN